MSVTSLVLSYQVDKHAPRHGVIGYRSPKCSPGHFAFHVECTLLQRVVRLAERISGSALPSLQDIYLKRCKSRAVKIIKDSNHPGNRLFFLLPSGKRFRSMMAKTERLRRSFFPQAIRLLNSNSVKKHQHDLL